MSIGNWLGAGARWVAILAVFLATAEVFARMDDSLTWRAPLLSPYTHDRLLVQDSIGFRGRPDYRYQKWRMNNLGFRGPDLALSPASGVVRIAVVGASETFGLYEREGFEFPARMQALLDSVAPGRFEVINAGLPGLSLASMVPYFERVVLPAQPRVLVVYPTPVFYLEIKPLPVVYTPPRLVPRPPPARLGPLTLEPDLFESRIATKARDVVKELVPTVLVTAVREGRLARIRAAHSPEWIWRGVPEDRLTILRQHLERLVTTVEARGVQVALVTHTNRFIGSPSGVTGDSRRHLVNLMSLYYPQATPEVLVAVDSVANQIIRQVAKEHGAAVVDVEGRIPPTSRYFADYSHFTDPGADSMARILTAAALRLAGDSTPPAAPVPAGPP